MNAGCQITLFVDRCQAARTGDRHHAFVADFIMTIVWKSPGATFGTLSHVKGAPALSDEESTPSTFDQSM